VPSVIQSTVPLMKPGARLTVVAEHKIPVEVDFSTLLPREPIITTSMGHPTEIFEVTDEIIAEQAKFAAIISHRFGYEQTLEALKLAQTPGATDKVVVLFD
jgi:threonine dehydrogenase-like Zn-dependent dehydrogenase